MSTAKSALLGAWLVAGLFMGVAIYGAVQGRMTAVLLGVGSAVVVLGVAARRKQADDPSAGDEPR